MLDTCIASAPSNNPCVLACRHHLAAGGSRLRAAICLDASKSLALDQALSCQLASICELLHNASLIHDDLLDRAPLRRGQPSVWALFGDGIAVCTGDLMLSTAHAIVATITPSSLYPSISNLVHRRVQEVILGQAAELDVARSMTTTAQEYEALARNKSASLLSLSLELPLLAAGYELALSKAQAVVGSFSVAYQIADDLEDVEQDRLANSLNLVNILSSSEHLSPTQARERASARAEDLLRSSIRLAQELPQACATMLVDHAETLLTRLAPVSGLPVPLAHG